MQTYTYDTIETWLKGRETLGIGASDAPAILGLTPWRSPIQVYHEKRKTFDKPIEPKYAEMARWGLLLEDVIAERYAISTGREVVAPGGPGQRVIVQHDTAPFMVATLDRWALDNGPALGMPARVPLELKNAHYMTKDDWEEPKEGHFEPPLPYIVQLQHQLAITGAEWGSLAVLIGGSEFRYADVKRDDNFIKVLMEREAEFWDNVLRGREPLADGSDATKDILRRLYPKDNGETIDLPPEAIEWDQIRAHAALAMKEAESLKKDAENKIKQAIGPATYGVLRNGVRYSFKTQSREAYSVEAGEFRVLRGGTDLKPKGKTAKALAGLK